MKYRLTVGKHYRRGEDGDVVKLSAGDVFEPIEEELKAFRDRLEPVIQDEAIPTIVSGEKSPEIGAEAATEATTNDPDVSLDQMVDEKTGQALNAAGIHSMEALTRLLATDPDALAKIKGIGKAKAKQIREALMALDEPSLEA